MKRMAATMMALCGSLILSTEAQACRFAPPGDTAARKLAARETVKSTTAIIDAEVVRPYESEKKPAILRATRVIKGPRGKRFFFVRGATSCHIQFGQKGKIGRVLLFGGPRFYEARMYASPSEDIDAALSDMRLK